MVTDWTPQEEEAWAALTATPCPTPEESIELARRLNVGYIYYCLVCDDHHVRRLPSEWQQLELPLRDAPSPYQTWARWGETAAKQDDGLGSC